MCLLTVRIEYLFLYRVFHKLYVYKMSERLFVQIVIVLGFGIFVSDS